MTKHFYMQFHVGDWMKDQAVGSCTPATRGVWMDLLCAMHEAGRTGELTGTREALAVVARCSVDELLAAVTELANNRTADILRSGDILTIINRRMRRESISRSAKSVRLWMTSSRRRSISARLIRRDGPGCQICGSAGSLQNDHRHPVSRGGTNDIANLQLLCGTCNRRKWAKVL